jgi:hypothetical protein
MHLPLAQHIHSSKLLSLLLLALMLMIAPPSNATLYVYTYTGNTFTSVSGPDFTAPSANYHITAEFTYDGALAPGVYGSSIPFSLTDGVHTLHSGDPGLAFYSMYIHSVDANTGLPTSWYLGLGDLYRSAVTPGIFTIFQSTEGPDLDGCWFGELSAGLGTPAPGGWTRTEVGAPVPIPGAIWFLGSGLIGLIGIRKKLKK